MEDKDPTLKIYDHADMFRVTLMLNNLTGYGFKDSDEPSVENILAAARKKMNKDALPIYEKYKKPILIEFIYGSSYTGAAGSAGQHWDNVPGITTFYGNDPTNPMNQQVQANMYEAALVLAHEYDWLMGVSSFNYGLSDRDDKEASIRGKLAEQVVQKWYRWINPNKTHLTTTVNENGTIAPYNKGGKVSHLGSYLLSKDTTVTVTATANEGYGFVKWTGDASGSSPTIAVSMNTDKTISAIFEVVNQSPVVTALSDVTINEDQSSTITLSATDSEGDAINYSAASDTNAVIASISSDTLTLMPNANWHGVATITAYASDGTSTDSTSFKLTVDPVQDIPKPFFWNTVESDSINITKDNLNSTYDLDWTESVDVDGDTINYIMYAKIGSYPYQEIYDTTATLYRIPYAEIAEGAFEGLLVISPQYALPFGLMMVPIPLK